MAPASSQDAAAVFEPLRPLLIRVAYRMLGSVADAEDVVQDAFLRWLDVDGDAVREPGSFSASGHHALCLDRLRSVRRERDADAVRNRKAALAKERSEDGDDAGCDGNPKSLAWTESVDDPAGGERADGNADADPGHHPGDAFRKLGGRDQPFHQGKGRDEGW